MFQDMSTVTEIEQALEKLAPEELVKFREWFAEFDAAQWDCQFEQDVAAGRLDALAEEALRDLREGRCKDRGTSGCLASPGQRPGSAGGPPPGSHAGRHSRRAGSSSTAAGRASSSSVVSSASFAWRRTPRNAVSVTTVSSPSPWQTRRSQMAARMSAICPSGCATRWNNSSSAPLFSRTNVRRCEVGRDTKLQRSSCADRRRYSYSISSPD